MIRWPLSLAIREMQTKTTVRYLYTPMRLATIEIVITPNTGENVPKLDYSYIFGDNVKW